MKGAGRDFMLILGLSVVGVVFFAKNAQTAAILQQLGGTSAQVIAALQARDSNSPFAGATGTSTGG